LAPASRSNRPCGRFGKCQVTTNAASTSWPGFSCHLRPRAPHSRFSNGSDASWLALSRSEENRAGSGIPSLERSRWSVRPQSSGIAGERPNDRLRRRAHRFSRRFRRAGTRARCRQCVVLRIQDHPAALRSAGHESVAQGAVHRAGPQRCKPGRLPLPADREDSCDGSHHRHLTMFSCPPHSTRTSNRACQ